MRRDNRVKNPRWLAQLSQQSRPGRVVNLCFIIVLLLSTVLTWREVAVLEDAYVTRQQNSLANVARAFDARMQHSIDDMRIYHDSMPEAINAPLPFEALRHAKNDFDFLRKLPEWVISLDVMRTIPVKGVSDAFVEETNLLSRAHPWLENELTATLELGYLMYLSRNASRFAWRTQYISRAGFYLSSEDLHNTDGADILSSYYSRVAEPWMVEQTPLVNPSRKLRWYSTMTPEITLTASMPVDYRKQWLGVLVMDFDLFAINTFLANAAVGEGDGRFQLYDRHMNLIAHSGDVVTLSERDNAFLAGTIEKKSRGGIRFSGGYISWQRLADFDGVILRFHTFSEGVRSDFGTISIALTLLWLLFTSMLFISWGIIRRMVLNMSQMQRSLEWQAWHDPLTRLYNRGALFDRAEQQASLCQKAQEPLAVIQLDLDHFKNINDSWGHQAGDRVLAHVGGLIGSVLRSGDIAGRVGGEEFCILLPGTALADAQQIAERIRLRLNSKEILLSRGTTIRISASLGVSSSEEHQQYDFEQLQSVADNRLYRAKQQGRNRVQATD
ncbi:MAG TPA: cellulose biosynthesis regulator diguanylate cyclase DgcQ [Enterobacteriaceae bacterium]|nr:cellulose biosynthesis regulator diguanylate cyclase DgcQ [Enterobacteriaceae bacterium]